MSKHDDTTTARSHFRRRRFLAGAMAAGGGAITSIAFQALSARAARAGSCWAAGYGPLRPGIPLPSPALDRLGGLFGSAPILMLPLGFTFSVVSVQGMPMSDLNGDGTPYPVPGAMDGMEAFQLPNGNIRLIRNHEDRLPPSELTRQLLQERDKRRGPRAKAYDENGAGGTTSLEVQPHGLRRLIDQHWSLVGTTVNCAGGRTPWGSWITCEETTAGPAINVSSGSTCTALPTGYQKPHGYCFEVPVDTHAGAPATPVPLRGLGRMSHEAVAVDPVTGMIYETEDNGSGDAGFYRWVPPVGATVRAYGDLQRLHAEDPHGLPGTLQMLKVKGQVNQRLFGGVAAGTTYDVEWVTIDNPDPNLELVSPCAPPPPEAYPVVRQGLLKGAAVFKKLEGAYHGEGKIFFVASHGGPFGAGSKGLGQVWEYSAGPVTDPASPESSGGILRCLYDASDYGKLDGPDNVCVSPRGGLILCEDGAGAQYLRGLTPAGEVFDLARNVYSPFEFAGACFSPDGSTLFVNLFSDSGMRSHGSYDSTLPREYTGPDQAQLAMTLAIWGPWQRGCL